MKKVIIYGSCVTIDIFRFYPKDIEIVDYFARSCMFSLNSQPLDFKIEEINLESEFQKRLVIRDFTKEFFTTIKEKPFDYLLIDLLEELSDVLSTNDTIITKSNELINSGFLKLHPEFKEIKRHSSDITLWEEECKSFIHKITNVVNPNKIILVKAMLAKKYYNKEREIQSFNPEKIKNINIFNNLLDSYYEYFKLQCPECNVVIKEDVVGNESHIWGLNPAHYSNDWYESISNQLDLIFPHR